MKYPIFLQHSEEDCGAACLAAVAMYYGQKFALYRTREAVGTGSQGTTLLGLRRGAEALGFHARQVKASPELIEHLDQVPLPVIIHWHGNHWVVLYGQRRNKYVIADPAVGVRYINRQELLEGWPNGVMLLLKPDGERFYSQPEDKISGIGRFLKLALPYRTILIEAILLNLAVGLLALSLPIMMQILTDDVLVRGDSRMLATLAIAVIAMNLFRSGIQFLQSILIGQFGERLELGLILDYGSKLLRLPMSYFDARRSGEVVSRISDVEEVNSLISQLVLGVPSQLFISLVSLGLMAMYSWQLTIASVIGFCFIVCIILAFLPAQRQKSRRYIAAGTDNDGFLVETFRGAMVLKTTQATPQAWNEYQKNFGRLANLSWSSTMLELYSRSATEILSGAIGIGLLWMGSSLVINGQLTLGQLIAFNGMSANFFGFLGLLVGLADEFVTAQVVIQRLTEVLDATPEDDSNKKKPWAEIKGTDDIACEDLNFHHMGRVPLLEDLSVRIPGGQVTALIGESGCGKSTLAKLLAGLYSPQSGNIRFGLYNQKDLSLACLRKQVALVPQEPHFWSRSILDNFRFSYPDTTFEQVVASCELVMADEFIRDLPDNYQTVLGEFGANLSGGQRQRLAIARAIVNTPPILILDESTAALDPVSESRVLERLLEHRKGMTTLIISHRPSVIQRADAIVFLERGELKISGTTQELRNRPGSHLAFLS